MRNQLYDLLKLFLGESHCVLCHQNRKGSLTWGICRTCQVLIERELVSNLGRPLCRSCGQPLLSEINLCSDCQRETMEWKNHALFYYNGIARDLIHLYKFHGYRRLSRYFAFLIHNKLKKNGLDNRFIVPIPPSFNKMKRKGWDQIDLIANDLAVMGYRVIKLLRKRKGLNQKELGREGRLKSISNRYYIIKQKNIPKNVLLLDDVMTTGSTLGECMKILIENGIEDISTLTIARDS